MKKILNETEIDESKPRTNTSYFFTKEALHAAVSKKKISGKKIKESQKPSTVKTVDKNISQVPQWLQCLHDD